MELVTEPVITSAKQAGDFARELQLLLRYLGVAEANMEKGEMRVEANISLNMGTKVEVKNLNSFRSVERAIDYELARQQEALAKGEKIVQETRGWDDAKGATYSQRQKESAHDYRYFPDPDLPKLKLSEIPEFQNLTATIPELPWQKRERLSQLGFLQAQDIEQLVGDFELAKLFDEVATELKDSELVKTAANFILNDVAGKRKKDATWPLPTVAHLAEVTRLYQAGKLPSPQAKSSILSGQIAEVVDESSLAEVVDKIIAANPKVAADYRAGKEAALQFLVGQGMKESRGAANPETLKKLFKEKLL
jgi:aspartyl-tRNA(Asn)/glutamyl-tRNA(Gln) amidotransferase subunit B